MEPETFDDLRHFIEAAKKVGEFREIKGADWDLEIGALIEATAAICLRFCGARAIAVALMIALSSAR